LLAIQSLAHVGIWEWDIPSNRLTWSAELCRIYGVDSRTFVATAEQYHEFVHPDDRERARGEIERAISACAPFRFEERIIRPDGKIRVLRSQGEVIADDHGKPLRLVGVCQDITEYREAMDALRESEERFRLLAEGVQDYAIFMLDPQGHIISWNSGAVRIKGYRTGEVLGRHFSLFYSPGDIGRGVPVEALRQATTAGTWAGEGWRLRKDGSRFWANAMITALYDSGGRLRGFSKVTRDITEQQLGKEQLSRQRQLLETILSQAADAIIACDAEGRMVFVNAAARRLAEHDPEGSNLDLAPDYWGNAFDTDGRPVPREAWSMSRALRGETTVGRQIHMIRADGSAYDILISAAPTTGSDGRVIGAVATFSDITQRKQAEAAMHSMTQRLRALSNRLLEVQEAERRHLARELHDEIGQSLTALKINLESANRAAQGARVPRLCEDMIGIVDRLLDQVRNLSLDLRPSLLDDLGLAEALRWYADRQAQRSGICIFFYDDGQAPAAPPAVTTACFRIAQEALTNVIRHANAGMIHIGLSRYDDMLELVVTDDGRGFDVHAMLQYAAQGASLGLLGMLERAELLRGNLWIDSHPGRGTAVRARFPLTAPSRPATEDRSGA
jgi:PAS domain S-box-containing protein